MPAPCTAMPLKLICIKFSEMALDNEMPTGNYSVYMIGEDQQCDIAFEDNVLLYLGQHVLGVALVRVTPPQTLVIPALNFPVAGKNIGINFEFL